MAAPRPAGRAVDAVLTARLEARCRNASGTIGVAVIHVESGRTAAVQGANRFPLFSVFKLPLAVAVLKDVEKKRLNLDTRVRFTGSDVVPGSAANSNLWRRPVERTVRELLELSLVRSDNTSSDRLLHLVGGPTAVTRRMRSLGLRNIEVRYSVREFLASRGKHNMGSPADLARLLARIQEGQVLNPPQQTLLLGLMTRATTGLRRLRGKLPAGTPVADKTGSGRPGQGTHDVGLITLPGGKGHLAMAVLVTGSRSPTRKQEDLIAELARLVYDWYVSPRARVKGARP